MGEACSCQCHIGPYAACDAPGGCGSSGGGCASDPAGACTLCRLYRPNTRARVPHQPPVCDGDRQLLGRHLGDIANLIADLSNDEPAVVDQRRYERFVIKNGHVESLGEAWADPLSPFGGVAPINSRSKQPSVSGSRERPIPINTAALDLKASARVPNPSPAVADWPEDQIGHLSAATLLDAWCRDVRNRLLPDHHLPPGTVDEMVAWLKHRVDLICDRHPQAADFADAIRILRGALRAAAGETEPRPEPCDGVTCSRCEMRALCRRPGDTYRAECSICGTLYTEEEYDHLIAEQAKAERGRRARGEISALLRRF